MSLYTVTTMAPIMWTPEDRDAFLQTAVNSEENKGSKDRYRYKLYPKIDDVDGEDDPKKNIATKALANVLYPSYAKIPYTLYDMLVRSFDNDPYIKRNARYIVVLLKGSNAYTHILENRPDYFEYSDMDIIVNIDCRLSSELFDILYDRVNIALSKTVSQYKKILDEHLCFGAGARKTPRVFSDDLIQNFKTDYAISLRNLGFESPFDTTEIRNKCSRQSFMLLPSLVKDTHVVKVDVPHFAGCERIPLKKTPIFTSHNKTITFDRTPTLKGNFQLYRIKFNTYFKLESSRDDSSESDSSDRNEDSYQKVAADFIDISLPYRDDAELVDFWNTNRPSLINVKEPTTGISITVPDILSCIGDLHKMLFVYKCPESKREKRLAKYEYLKDIAGVKPPAS